MFVRSDDPPLSVGLDQLRQLQSEIDQPMASSMLYVFPELWVSSATLESSITTFEFIRKPTGSELLPPATVSVLVEIADQGAGNTGVVEVRADLSPVLTEVVVFDL